MSTHKKRKALHVGPNMTPMVDVVMCILIFFMLGSSFAAQEMYLTNNTPAVPNKGLGETARSDAKLPAAQQRILLKRVSNTTTVEAFGKPFEGIEDLKSGPDGASRSEQIGMFLSGMQKNLSKDVQIILVPEQNVPWQDVITLYDLCIKARFENVAFSTPK